jgi:hypothetical protein
VSSYYYLMAQLPGIIPNAPLPITYERFTETASRFLSAHDSRILEDLSLEPPRIPANTGSTVVDGWYAFERAIRLSLERLRAARLERVIAPCQTDDDSVNREFGSLQIARNAAAMENPLEAERYLDRCRRERIEFLSNGHFFDADAVFAYGLMLLLHERGDRFTAETGRASYVTIYKQILGE